MVVGEKTRMDADVAQGLAAKVVLLVDRQVQATLSRYKRSSIKEAARQVGMGSGFRTETGSSPLKGCHLTRIHQSHERVSWLHWYGPCSWLGLTRSNPSITLQCLKSEVK